MLEDVWVALFYWKTGFLGDLLEPPKELAPIEPSSPLARE
jgi:hypothetical protein